MATLLRYRQSVYGRVFVLTPLIFLFLACFKGYAQTPEITIHQGLINENQVQVSNFVYGNGIYLTCTYSPVNFFTSTDGEDWSRILGPDLGTAGSEAWQRPNFAYGAGRWVVAGDSGQIYSSPDLINWTRCVTNTKAKFNDVKYLDSTFYAVGDSSTFLSSPDGVNWTRSIPAPGVPKDWYDHLTFGNGYLVFTSFNQVDFASVIFRSANGAAGPWLADTVIGFNTVKFLRGRFYWLSGQMHVSTDAHTWTDLSPAGQDVFADSSHVYLVSNGTISTSDDGLNFSTPVGLNSNSSYGTYLNGHYFVFGEGALASTDGVHFHYLGSNRPSIATNGGNIVKVSPNPHNAYVYSSTDAKNWTLRDTLPHSGITQASGVIPQVVYDSLHSKYGIVSTNTYTSTDGVSWANAGAVSLPASQPCCGPYFPGMNEQFHVFYGGGNYMAWYADGWPQNNLVWHSLDGVSWNQSLVPSDPNNLSEPWPIYFMYNVRYTGGKFFLMDNDEGTYYQGVAGIHSSTDGSDFSTDALHNKWPAGFHVQSYDDILYVPDSARYYVFGVGYMPGQPASFFCVSTPNLQDTSITLNNMTTISGLVPGDVVADDPFNTYGGFHFTYNKGHFAGVVLGYGGRGYLIWSSDGAHWDSQQLNASTQITSSIVSGDTIRMAGSNNFLIEVIFHDSTGAALPDSLLNFNAVSQGDTSVLLSWQTSTEHNTRDFVIQRKTNGKSAWTEIGRINAAGNSQTVTDYSFIDPSPQVGFNHYRVQLQYTDTTVLTSAVRTVKIKRHPHFKVFPNPARDHVTIVGSDGVPGVITLYDASGRERIQQNYDGSTIILPLGDLRTGIYRLVIRLRDDSRYEQPILHVK